MLDKIVQQIIVLLIVVVLLFVGTVILKNQTVEKQFEWKYNQITTAKDVLGHGKKVNDRYLYWQLKDIIYNYIYTSQDEEYDNTGTKEEKFSYLDYYEVLSKKYKRHLNKEEYQKIANTFINKFLQEDHLGYKYVSDFIIQDIYKYNNNMYICVLLEEYTGSIGYIGIQLNEEKSQFEIFYIE